LPRSFDAAQDRLACRRWLAMTLVDIFVRFTAIDA
jgi:hypothetical protein